MKTFCINPQTDTFTRKTENTYGGHPAHVFSVYDAFGNFLHRIDIGKA